MIYGEPFIVGGAQNTGTLPIERGGTGATDAATARTNLGAAASSHNHSAANITSGTLPIARGGTGATTKANARTNIGVYVQSSAPSGASGDLWAW